MKITMLAEHNCAVSSIAGFVDALSIANLWRQHLRQGDAPLFQTEVVTLDGRPVTANGGLTIEPVKALDRVEETDLVLLPSFLMPFDLQNPRIKTICRWVRERYRTGGEIACTCTGSFLLAETGLLDGRLATTNWQFARLFRQQYPQVDLQIDRVFTEDHGLYCTGAATAFMDLCLHLIEKYGSADRASWCARALLVDTGRNSQAPYAIQDFRKSHGDKQIFLAQQWMERNLQTRLAIDAAAGVAGISPRHFKRRFKTATGDSPLSYLQRLRIEAAKRYLEKTRDSLSEITAKVGYEDLNSFRRLFIKHTGLSPRQYRNKFAAPGLAE